MVWSYILELGILPNIIAPTLKGVLVDLNWRPFEAWLGIHRGKVITTNKPLAPLVVTIEESVGSNETPKTPGGG